MRALWAVGLLAAFPAMAQEEQQARAPNQPTPNQPAPNQSATAGTPVYDMVAGDRETAWRINRVTGEIIICRVDTTGSLEAARARCSPAVVEPGPQQSQTPLGGGRP